MTDTMTSSGAVTTTSPPSSNVSEDGVRRVSSADASSEGALVPTSSEAIESDHSGVPSKVPVDDINPEDEHCERTSTQTSPPSSSAPTSASSPEEAKLQGEQQNQGELNQEADIVTVPTTAETPSLKPSNAEDASNSAPASDTKRNDASRRNTSSSSSSSRSRGRRSTSRPRQQRLAHPGAPGSASQQNSDSAFQHRNHHSQQHSLDQHHQTPYQNQISNNGARMTSPNSGLVGRSMPPPFGSIAAELDLAAKDGLGPQNVSSSDMDMQRSHTENIQLDVNKIRPGISMPHEQQHYHPSNSSSFGPGGQQQQGHHHLQNHHPASVNSRGPYQRHQQQQHHPHHHGVGTPQDMQQQQHQGHHPGYRPYHHPQQQQQQQYHGGPTSANDHHHQQQQHLMQSQQHSQQQQYYGQHPPQMFLNGNSGQQHHHHHPYGAQPPHHHHAQAQAPSGHVHQHQHHHHFQQQRFPPQMHAPPPQQWCSPPKAPSLRRSHSSSSGGSGSSRDSSKTSSLMGKDGKTNASGNKRPREGGNATASLADGQLSKTMTPGKHNGMRSNSSMRSSPLKKRMLKHDSIDCNANNKNVSSPDNCRQMLEMGFASPFGSPASDKGGAGSCSSSTPSEKSGQMDPTSSPLFGPSPQSNHGEVRTPHGGKFGSADPFPSLPGMDTPSANTGVDLDGSHLVFSPMEHLTMEGVTVDGTPRLHREPSQGSLRKSPQGTHDMLDGVAGVNCSNRRGQSTPPSPFSKFIGALNSPLNQSGGDDFHASPVDKSGNASAAHFQASSRGGTANGDLPVPQVPGMLPVGHSSRTSLPIGADSGGSYQHPPRNSDTFHPTPTQSHKQPNHYGGASNDIGKPTLYLPPSHHAPRYGSQMPPHHNNPHQQHGMTPVSQGVGANSSTGHVTGLSKARQQFAEGHLRRNGPGSSSSSSPPFIRLKLGAVGMKQTEARKGMEGINHALRGSPLSRRTPPPVNGMAVPSPWGGKKNASPNGHFPAGATPINVPKLPKGGVTTPGSVGSYPGSAPGSARGHLHRPPLGPAPGHFSNMPHYPPMSHITPTGKGIAGKENATPKSHKQNPCNCKKSKCLKLYCECFAAERYCMGCNCQDCNNTPEYEPSRAEAIKATRAKNPNAFKPRFEHKHNQGDNTVSCNPNAGHNMGCRCKKSACLKKYCECFEAGVMCGDKCKCVDCMNYVGSQALIDRRRKIKDIKGAEIAMRSADQAWKNGGGRGNSSDSHGSEKQQRGKSSMSASPPLAATGRGGNDHLQHSMGRISMPGQGHRLNGSPPMRSSSGGQGGSFLPSLHGMGGGGTPASSMGYPSMGIHPVTPAFPQGNQMYRGFSSSKGGRSNVQNSHLHNRGTPLVSTPHGSNTPTNVSAVRLHFDPISSKKARKVRPGENEPSLPVFGRGFPEQPKTTTLAVFSFLSNAELYNAGLVSKMWTSLALDEELWQF